ncbi:hypothetical protein DUNSADRAFT_5664 [Dunaliella salina]|uniref:Uncharacterized protein n=1 Tax=Dunaliella salina TaxID=3046 RepID=A0ABQ7GPY0_DUNSA|nr:hypothetical protein DUNSADRAFT_5664 [Dunaliella salina]|eukprot:KAF5836631.1 hypothetical protein DUNSADRAFT_5664 [Dunaliella salina]
MKRASTGKAAATAVPNNLCAVHFRTRCNALENREPSLLIPGGSNSNINPRPGTGPSKLILPGRQGPPSGGMGGRIIIPEQGTEKILAQGAQALGPELTTITGPNRYRPPAGFMNEDMSPENMETLKASPEEMLNRLRASGVPGAQQLCESTNAFSDGPFLSCNLVTLYSRCLRCGWCLTAMAMAMVMPDSGVPQECEVLARAMKEWERRPKERTGFSNLPADCMAFKHLRDAGECRKPDDIEDNLVKARKAAVTDGAYARIEQATQELLGTDAGGMYSGTGIFASCKSAHFHSHSLSHTLFLHAPSYALILLPDAAVEDLDTAPRASQEGAFGTFTISGAQGSSSSWVCLPQWKALAMAQHPVALSLADCSVVPAVVQALKCKTEDDKRRLQGSGLLVADKGVDVMRQLDESAFYLAASQEAAPGSSPPLQIVDGAMVEEGSFVGLAKIIFVARPPLRDMGMGPQARSSSEDSLIQI